MKGARDLIDSRELELLSKKPSKYRGEHLLHFRLAKPIESQYFLIEHSELFTLFKIRLHSFFVPLARVCEKDFPSCFLACKAE